MTFTQLKYLVAVAKHRNFTKAAKEVHATQPTLSMQIKALEDELGIKIFDRSKTPLRITAIGEKIIEQAKKILSENKKIDEIVRNEKGYIGGEFKLGVIPTLSSTLLPIFMKDFIQKYPKVHLQIYELTTEEIIRKLKEEELDAALLATPLEDPEIKELPLYNEPFVGFIPKGHRLYGKEKLRDEDLAVDDILLLEEGHCFRDNILNICRSDNIFPDKFYLETGSFETLIKLSKEGLGMTLLPYLHTLDLREEDKQYLKNFEKPEPAREISLVHYKGYYKKGIVNALYKLIKGIINGMIAFYDVRIISPLPKKRLAHEE
ncbi:MAG: LysR family transcriptional regulator [Chlorobi bacterium]|nr:LysR family transcriptional regulator [Chlorobiota bacterium]